MLVTGKRRRPPLRLNFDHQDHRFVNPKLPAVSLDDEPFAINLFDRSRNCGFSAINRAGIGADRKACRRSKRIAPELHGAVFTHGVASRLLRSLAAFEKVRHGENCHENRCETNTGEDFHAFFYDETVLRESKNPRDQAGEQFSNGCGAHRPSTAGERILPSEPLGIRMPRM